MELKCRDQRAAARGQEQNDEWPGARQDLRTWQSACKRANTIVAGSRDPRCLRAALRTSRVAQASGADCT
eukprot:scaffold249393_cov32-Tisochrysis_lutea.AAC.6